MAIYLNGTLIGQTNKVFFNGVQLSSTGKVYGNGTQVWMGGTLTLMAQVFNASGTFTMPSGVVNNQIIVACTGGGGGGYADNSGDFYGGGGGGSGRVVSTLTMSSGATASVIIGAGGAGAYTSIQSPQNAGTGGTSSFSGATSCLGGQGFGLACGGLQANGTSGGGKGALDVVSSKLNSTSASCPAVLALTNGAVDATGGLYGATSYAGGASNFAYTTSGGGGGGYGVGATGGLSASANTGAGGSLKGQTGTAGAGGSGKVIVFYYKYV